MAAFHEVLFPLSLSLGAHGGPERRTEVVTLANGREERNSPWLGSRRRWNAGVGLRTLDDLHALIAFFEARRGRLHGFRWRDPVDWKSCAPSQTPSAADVQLGTGNGLRTVFQLVKSYGSGGAFSERRIAKPVSGSVRVAVGGAALVAGAGFTMDATTGAITLAAAPAAGVAVTAGFEFDTPVRFDTERLDLSVEAFGAGSAPDVPVIEILV